ncbi:MAG: hypothetical protein ACI4RR_08940 [Eubacterium sp.]
MKKTIRIILSLLCVVTVVVLGLYFSTYVNSIFAKNYLAEKYNVEKSEIQLIDGRSPTIIWHNNGNIIGEPEWVDMSIKYKMNDREFFVQRLDFKFYDDYQIYDLEELGTKWLQENIDKYIEGISIESSIVYDFQLISQSNHMMCFSFDNVCEFLSFYFIQSEVRPIITISNNDDDKIDYTINKSIQDIFSIDEDIVIYHGKDGLDVYITNKKTGYWRIGFI